MSFVSVVIENKWAFADRVVVSIRQVCALSHVNQNECAFADRDYSMSDVIGP